jgi:peptidoglycan/xylan/chitin deacetylase (PgdA/CDA1 family)
MKVLIKTLFVITFGFIGAALFAQNNPTNTITAIPVEMLFPEGKSKAIILSYDDGNIADRKLVQLMNKFGLIGTFHLNSNKLGTKNYLTREEIKSLFSGHEISVHTANHPNLTTLSKIDIVYEVVEDRKLLETLTGKTVRGMAYPFGNNNDFVIDAIKGLGIEYARTVEDTYNFKIPENFLKWHPTIHQFAKAFWEPNKPENDKKELIQFYKIINDFLDSKELSLLDVWGHSWEIGTDQNKWDETEYFFKQIANKSAVFYTTQIGLVDYINAFKNLKFSVDKNIVTNLSAQSVYLKLNGKMFEIKAGATSILTH